MSISHDSRTAPTSCCRIEQTETVEHYLKALFDLTSDRGSAGTAELARVLEVSAPSVTAMVTRLRGAGLVEQAGWGQVVLTEHGRSHAVAVVRRHRLLETFLHDVLGIGWESVHAEAELLEHGMSERVEDLIDLALAHPARDPHGDPIPPKHGLHDEGAEVPLSHGRPGEGFRVLRVRDRDSAALELLSRLRIGLGAELDLLEPGADDGSWRVLVSGRSCLLPPHAVRAIRGEVVAEVGASS